jgi:hypothetical protein
MNKIDLAYIAGLMDGESYIGIKKSKAYKCQERQTPGYHARIQIRMVDEPAIKFVAETLGGWYYKEKPHSHKGRLLYCYQASEKSAEKIIKILLPYLKVKQATAQTVLELRELQSHGKEYRTKITGYRNFPAHGKDRQIANLSFSDEYVAQCDTLYLRCKELNRVGV